MGLTTSGGAKALEQLPKTEKASSGKTEPLNQATLLPDKPLFVIERSNAWTPTNLREFWAAISAAVTLIILVYSAFAFKRMEKEFAAVI